MGDPAVIAIREVSQNQIPSNRPDLAAALLKQRLTFAHAMFAVQTRLILHAMGMGAVKMRAGDIRALVDCFDAVRSRVRQLVSAVEVDAGAY